MKSSTEDKQVTPDDDILNISQNIKNDLNKLLEDDENEDIKPSAEEEKIQFESVKSSSPDIYDDDESSKKIEKDLQAANYIITEEIFNKYKGKFKIIICSQMGSRSIQKCFSSTKQEINGRIAEEVRIMNI